MIFIIFPGKWYEKLRLIKHGRDEAQHLKFSREKAHYKSGLDSRFKMKEKIFYF